MLKRFMVLVILVLFATAFLIACDAETGQADPPAPTPAQETTPAGEQDAEDPPAPDPAEIGAATISFMLPQTHYRAFMSEIIANFENEFQNIRVDVQAIPDEQWIDLVRTMAVVGELADVVRIDRGLLMEVGTENFLELTSAESWYSRAIPSQLEPKKVDGVLFGMPIGSDSAVGLIYNARIFEENNLAVPTDLASFISVSHELLELGYIPYFASDRDTWTTQIWLTATIAQDVDPSVWDRIMRNELAWADVPEIESSLDAMASFRIDGLTNSDFLAATYDAMLTAMADEVAAMAVSGQFSFGDIAALNPDVDLRMIPLPWVNDTLAVVQGTGQLSISSNTANAQAARLFLEFFSRPENMDKYTYSWGELPIFSDQQVEMPPWQRDLYEAHFLTGRIATEMNSFLAGVGLSDFWSLQQEMVMGSITAREALERWDVEFQAIMRAQGAEGFD